MDIRIKEVRLFNQLPKQMIDNKDREITALFNREYFHKNLLLNVRDPPLGTELKRNGSVKSLLDPFKRNAVERSLVVMMLVLKISLVKLILTTATNQIL